MVQQHFAAGILPISWIGPNKTFSVCIGRELRGGVADFGGKCEPKLDRCTQHCYHNQCLQNGTANSIIRLCPIATACREAYEESLGVLPHPTALCNRISPENTVVLRSRTQANNAYVMFVTELPWSPSMRSHFRKTLNFIRWKPQLNHRAIVEKDDLIWCSWDDLQHNMEKRTVFQQTLETHRALFERLNRMKPEDFPQLCRSMADDFKKNVYL